MLLTAVHIDDSEVTDDSVISHASSSTCNHLRSYHCDFTTVTIWLLL